MTSHLVFKKNSSVVFFFLFLLFQRHAAFAQFDTYPKVQDNKEWKKIFVDSLGNVLGNYTFDNVQPFMKGIAVVQNRVGEDMESALLNSSGKFLVPFGSHYIRNEGNGFATVSNGTTTTLYNNKGKQLFQCQACSLAFYEDLHAITCQAQVSYYEDNTPAAPFKGVLVMDWNGKEMFKREGDAITRLTNISTVYPRNQKPEPRPYFIIKVPREDYKMIYDIVKPSGELLLDSLTDLSFSEIRFFDDTLYVYHAGKAGILDANFQPILNFDLGYSTLFKMGNHPRKNVYSAGKNGKYGAITIKNEIVVPFRYHYPLQFMAYDSTYQMNNPNQDSVWTFDMNGDTLEEPGYRFVTSRKSKTTAAIFIDPRSGKYGYMQRKNKKIIIPAIYNHLSIKSRDSLFFFKGDTAGFMNSAGKRIFTFPTPCYGASGFENGRAMCVLGLLDGKAVNLGVAKMEANQDNFQTKYVWVDAKGKIINNAVFDWFARFEKGMALVNNEGRYYVVDTAMKRVKLQNRYDYQSYFRQGYAVIGEGANKFGLIDSSGKIVIPVVYDAIAIKSEQTVVEQYRNIQDGIPFTGPQGEPAVTNGFFYVPDIIDGLIKVTRGENEQDLRLFGNKTPGKVVSLKPAVPDSILQLYNYDHDIILDDLEKEHISLDGKEVSMIPFRQDAQFGFVNKKTGAWVVEPQFEQVFAVYKEGAIVKTDREYGVVDTTGKLLFDGFRNVFREGNLYHCQEIHTGDSTLPEEQRDFIYNAYFSLKGKLVFEEKAHDQETFQHGDSLAFFRYGKTITVRGQSGKVWQKLRLNVVKPFVGIYNNLLVYRTVINGRVHYSAYTANNKLVFSIPLNFDEIIGPYKINPNLFGFYGKGGVYFADAKGLVKPYGLEDFPEGNDWSAYFKADRFVVKHFNKKKYGVIDTKGNVIIPFQYTYLGSEVNGYSIYRDTTKAFGLMDRKGNKVVPYLSEETLKLTQFLGESITFYEGLCVLQQDCFFLRENERGERYSRTDEDSACFYYVDTTGKEAFTLKAKYKLAGHFRDGLAPVLDYEGNFGFIDKTGKLIIPAEYEAMMAGGYPIAYLVVPEFINGYAYIKSYKGYIDKSGKKYFAGERLKDHYNFSH